MCLRINFILLKKNNKGICRLPRTLRIVFSDCFLEKVPLGISYSLFLSISGPGIENMKRCLLIWGFKCAINFGQIELQGDYIYKHVGRDLEYSVLKVREIAFSRFLYNSCILDKTKEMEADPRPRTSVCAPFSHSAPQVSEEPSALTDLLATCYSITELSIPLTSA